MIEQPSSRIDVQPVVLAGTHVRLEPLEARHLDGIIAAGQDASIWQWMPVMPRTHEEYEHWMSQAFAQQAAGTQLPFATIDAASGDVIGSTRLLAISAPDSRVEIGWTWLTPSVQRSPVNTECKYLLLRHCFEDVGCMRVELKTDSRNSKSRNAILRIGATEEGTFRKHQRAQHGVQRDTVWYSILFEEWPGVKQRLEAMLAR